MVSGDGGRRWVVVTGAAGGIGRALVAAFGGAGWDVAAVDVVNGGPATPGVRAVTADAADPAAMEALAVELAAAGARVACVVNNAAVQVVRPLLETSAHDWDRTWRVNVGSIWATTRAFVPGMRDGGAIVNIASVHARATSPGLAAYAASKGAVCSLTRALAVELAARGVRVNAVLPGAVDTPMLDAGLARGGDPAAGRARLAETTPLGRVATPEDVARLVVFLAEDTSRNITGQELVCDGGVLARLASE